MEKIAERREFVLNTPQPSKRRKTKLVQWVSGKSGASTAFSNQQGDNVTAPITAAKNDSDDIRSSSAKTVKLG